MTCPSSSIVADFLERRLLSEQRTQIEIHLADCGSCRALLIDAVSGLPSPSSAAEAHTTCPAGIAPGVDSLARGTAVGRFIVLDLLGAGGMGIVYTAYDPELDRKVALKLLRRAADANQTPAPRLTEAQAMARISHSNVIAVYDVGTYRDHIFAAMELVEGCTLRRWLAQPRGWREVVEVFALAGAGLAAAHASGVVHRDFKPENVLLGGDGRVKVSDFGLATLEPAATPRVGGTPGYLAVEALRPGPVDERSDQFAFCVALHEALHGRRPFAAQTYDELVLEVRRGPSLYGTRRDVPARLNHVICRGLALSPMERYPSMRELLVDIRRTMTAHRGRRIAAAVFGALGLAMAVALVAKTGAPDGPPPCNGGAALLAGVWDTARRGEVHDAWTRAEVPVAAGSFETVAATLDRYTARWTTTWTEVCEATEVRHEQSAMLHDLRMACLDRARIALRNLVDTFGRADTGAVLAAVSGAAVLPALDLCSDAEALNASIPSPPGSTARMQIPASVDAQAPAEPTIDPELTDRRLPPSHPDFRLPFGCGETWRVAFKAGRRHAERQIHFSLPDDKPSARLAVFASAPGWVSGVNSRNGQVDIHHGAGWFTTYQHMTDISVSLHQYVGRGQVIGRVGNVNVQNALGGPGPGLLYYEQVYQPGVANPSFERASGHGEAVLYFDWERFDLSRSGPQIRTSTNNCSGGGAPGSATPYDVPTSATPFSLSQATMEIVVRRSSDHALFERWYRDGWNGAAMPYAIAGRPAVAVFEGKLHVIARKVDGSIVDVHYSPFTGWAVTPLPGTMSGDPDVAVYGWDRNLHVAARGRDGYLYRWYTAIDGTWTKPVRVSGIEVVGTPAVFSHYDKLYIVARGSNDSLWSWETDRQRGSIVRILPGTAVDSPVIAVDPRSRMVNVISRGRDNLLYRWQFTDPDRIAGVRIPGWIGPDVVDPGRSVIGTPATMVYKEAMHIVARAPSGAVHHWWRDSGWQWQALPGAYSGDPDVIQFGDQLQTIGRAPNGGLQTIWYDPSFGVWHAEDHDVEVGH